MKSCLVLMALLASLNATASIVDIGESVTDSVTGLEWLKLTDSRTIGQSVLNIQQSMTSGGVLEGWRYASSAQVATLVSHYFGTPVLTNKTTLLNTQSLNDFINLIGSTGNYYANTLGYADQKSYLIATNQSVDWVYANYTQGWLADSTVANENWLASLNATSWIRNSFLYGGGYASIPAFSSPNTLANDYSSSFLVRDFVISSPVPEPSSYALLLIGLTILAVNGIAKAKKTVAY